MLAYEPELEMAFSDEPEFPVQEEAATWDRDSPLEIEEWKTYYAKFYTKNAPSLIRNAGYIVKPFRPQLQELNFENFVGLSRIGNLHLNVVNRKILPEQYESMLDELAEYYASLVFSFDTRTGQQFDKNAIGQDSHFVEYLFLRKYLLHGSCDIDTIGDLIGYDPHRKFESELQACPVDECQTASEKTMMSLVTGPMVNLQANHPLGQTYLGRIFQKRTRNTYFPARGAKEIKYLTVDTHENRFIKFFMEGLLAKVEIFEKVLVTKSGSYLNPVIQQNIDLLRRKVSQFLSHNMWREVGIMRFVPVSSQVLQRKEGYRQLYTLYSLLQLATQCAFPTDTEFKTLIETKDVPTLYEYWCFFQIKTVLDKILTGKQKVSRLLKKTTQENVLNNELSEGLRIEYQGGIQLFFNKTYYKSAGLSDLSQNGSYIATGESYSNNFRPDIIIEQNGQKLIFDAKYKGERSNDGTINKCKDEDINKMHCYHDAIQNVIGSFILFPGTQNIVFPGHGNKYFFEGVGALALRPGISRDNSLSKDHFIWKIISEFLAQSVR